MVAACIQKFGLDPKKHRKGISSSFLCGISKTTLSDMEWRATAAILPFESRLELSCFKDLFHRDCHNFELLLPENPSLAVQHLSKPQRILPPTANPFSGDPHHCQIRHTEMKCHRSKILYPQVPFFSGIKVLSKRDLELNESKQVSSCELYQHEMAQETPTHGKKRERKRERASAREEEGDCGDGLSLGLGRGGSNVVEKGRARAGSREQGNVGRC